jgi:hypothetical protein
MVSKRGTGRSTAWALGARARVQRRAMQTRRSARTVLTARAAALVPKLHLGTHLPAKLYFATAALSMTRALPDPPADTPSM